MSSHYTVIYSSKSASFRGVDSNATIRQLLTGTNCNRTRVYAYRIHAGTTQAPAKAPTKSPTKAATKGPTILPVTKFNTFPARPKHCPFRLERPRETS